MRLDGKTAVVTGSSRGIGKTIATVLAEHGANIILNGTTDKVDLTAEELKRAGHNVAVVKGSVASIEVAQSLSDTAVNSFGRIDLLVNCAGITNDMLIIKMQEEDWDSVMNVNLKGTFLCTKSAIRYMMKQKYGRIINITSVIGQIGNVGQTNYSASKAGIIGFTKSIAKEYATKNITCNAIAPGLIESDMTEVLSDAVKQDYLKGIPLKRFGTSSDVAKTVAFLASEYADYITGQIINVDGGLVM